MKKFMILILILINYNFGAELSWKDDWREVGTHGYYMADWTKKISTPADCNIANEQRLETIVLVSLNILNKKPSEWLNGRYLEYVNKNCEIWKGLTGTPYDFEKKVNRELSTDKQFSKTIGIIFIVCMYIFGIIFIVYYIKFIMKFLNKYI